MSKSLVKVWPNSGETLGEALNPCLLFPLRPFALIRTAVQRLSLLERTL